MGLDGVGVFSALVKTASISQAGDLTAKTMSMAYTNAALAFNSTSGLSYTYNNQLTGDNLISTTLTDNSTGLTLGHSGQHITITDFGIVMTSTTIKALSAGLYPLLLADVAGSSVAFITDA